MGFWLRAKLKTLPVARLGQPLRELLASVGTDPRFVDMAVKNQQAAMAEHLLAECHSVEEIESSIAMRLFCGTEGTWEKAGPYLLYFRVDPAQRLFGIRLAPPYYIMRTAESTWRIQKVPSELLELWNNEILEAFKRRMTE